MSRVSCRDCKNIIPISVAGDRGFEYAECLAFPRGARYNFCSVMNPNGRCEEFESRDSASPVAVPPFSFWKRLRRRLLGLC